MRNMTKQKREDNGLVVLLSVAKDPYTGTSPISIQVNINRTSIRQVLKKYRLHFNRIHILAHPVHKFFKATGKQLSDCSTLMHTIQKWYNGTSWQHLKLIECMD